MGLGFRDRDGIDVCLYLAGGMLSQSPPSVQRNLEKQVGALGFAFLQGNCLERCAAGSLRMDFAIFPVFGNFQAMIPGTTRP